MIEPTTQNQGLQIKRTVVLITIVGLLTVSLGGCDSFLEKDTSGKLVTSSFYKTEQDLNAAVTGAWNPILEGGGNSFGSNSIWVPLMGSDDITTHPGLNKARYRAVDRFNAHSNIRRLDGVFWNSPYQAIYRANTLLANLEGSPAAQEAKDQAAAQVRFLRGFLYFWLTRIFGPVPLRMSPEPNAEAQRAPVAEVYEQIVEDLTFAEEHLPETWPSAPGKPTRWSTKAMLARVYLTMAGWPLNEESNYALARDKFKEVMNSGQFRLLDDFAALWQIENKWNDEYVYALPFCRPCGNHAVFAGNATIPPAENGWIDMFGEVGFFNDFPEGPRKEATYHTVFDDGTHWKNGKVHHPFFSKWRSGTTHGGDGAHPVQSSRSLPLIRYPHVLLGFAEAQAMADGAPNAAAYAAVNKVRSRAGRPDLTPGLEQQAFRDSVIVERGWEFAGEFTRWFDLIRTEKVAEANARKASQDMKPLRDIQAMPKEHFYWMPIPQRELDLNPNMEQNAGY